MLTINVYIAIYYEVRCYTASIMFVAGMFSGCVILVGMASGVVPNHV